MPLSTKSSQTDRIDQFFKLFNESFKPNIEDSNPSDASDRLFKRLYTYDAKSFTIFENDDKYNDMSMDDFIDNKPITQLIDCEIIYFNGSFRHTVSHTFIFLKSQLPQIKSLIDESSNQLMLFYICSELTNRKQLSVEPMSLTSTLFNASIINTDYETANKIMCDLNTPQLINEIVNCSDDTFDSFIDLPLLEKFSHQTASNLVKDQNDINIQYDILLLSKVIHRISHSIEFTTN